MTKIEEIQDIFNMIKYFKSFHTDIKFSNIVYLKRNENDNLDLFFDDDIYYIMTGELIPTNEFACWVNIINKDDIFEFNSNDLAEVKKCLKKNCIDISYDENEFVINYKNKEDELKDFSIKRSNKNLSNNINKIKEFKSTFNKKIESNKEIDGMLILYEDSNNNPTFIKSENSNKILEIPFKKLLSLLKVKSDYNNYIIEYGKSENRNYVSVKSEKILDEKNQNLKIKLEEYFITI